MILLAVRTTLLYLAVIAGLRIMGKRQIGEMQAGELVVTILISDLAAIPLQDAGRPVVHGLTAIFLLILLELICSAVALRSSRVRHLLSGRPVAVIRNGVIDQKALRQLRMTADDLLEALRQQGVFDPREVAWALVETNGKISLLPRPDQAPATAAMVGATPPPGGLPCTVVCDGEIQTHTLTFAGLTEAEVRRVLRDQQTPLPTVYLMIRDGTGQFFVVPREEKA